MLAQELEDVGPNETVAILIRNTKDINDTEGVVLDCEFVISDYQILRRISIETRQEKALGGWKHSPLSTLYKMSPFGSERSSSRSASAGLVPCRLAVRPHVWYFPGFWGCFLF